MGANSRSGRYLAMGNSPIRRHAKSDSSRGAQMLADTFSLSMNKEESVNETQRLTEKRRYSSSMTVDELIKIAVSLMRPNEDNHKHYLLPNID